MPAPCTAFGCRTGYHNEPKQAGVWVHRFPLNKPELLKHWLQNMHHENFTPSKHSVICSLHFADSDFYQCRTDKQTRHTRHLNENLKNRRLKDDAVPRIFSGMPNYLMEESPRSRSVTATSGSERNKPDVSMKKLRLSFGTATRLRTALKSKID